MKKSDKRGLSAVVTTLIIILLVLVAVGIVWVVVRNIIEEGAEEVFLGKLTLDLEVKDVKINSNSVDVRVKRNPGKGELSGIKFVVSDGANTEIFEQTNITLEELGEKSFTFSLTSLNDFDIETISIAPIFKSASGKESFGKVADVYNFKEECVADCEGKVCGSDGCGGSWGTCGVGETCVGGSCDCAPDCSCASTTCIGSTCSDGCEGTCAGTLAPDCGLRVCGPAPNTCGSANECGTCNSTSDCISGVCEFNATKFIINLGAVSWWRFEGNALDEVGGNHGTAFGNPVMNLTGGYNGGGAYEFDGVGDYIEIVDSEDFDISSNGFTYSAWIKPSNFNNLYNMFMGHHLPYFNVRNTQILHMSIFAEGSQQSVLGSTSLESGNWYHVVATYDSLGYMKVYLEGEEDGIAGPWTPANNFNYNQYIGKWNSGSTFMFTGFIDEPMIFNRALTETEVLALYELELS